MTNPKILAFAGSARRASFNKQLAAAAAEAARAAGAEVTLLDLADYPMPLYDGDLEEREGLPEPARAFKRVLAGHAGWLIACPEYNSSITPLLKNAIDWASRAEGDEPPLVCFRGKLAGLLATSPGALGGLRGLVTVRSILSSIGVLVVPDQLAVPKAHEVFRDGALADEVWRERVAAIARRTTELAGALTGE